MNSAILPFSEPHTISCLILNLISLLTHRRKTSILCPRKATHPRCPTTQEILPLVVDPAELLRRYGGRFTRQTRVKIGVEKTGAFIIFDFPPPLSPPTRGGEF
jgi:hypothetical protein